MSADQKYVLDANAFIQSNQKFYAFDICPGYWKALLWHHGQGTLCSIDRVAAELARGGDQLSHWAEDEAPGEFFVSTDESEIIATYGQVIGWVQEQTQFLPEAKAEFAETSRADAWLIAYAKITGRILVTLEDYNPNIRKRVPIPNVCRAAGMDVECVTIFQMLRALQSRFSWEAPA